MLSRDVEGAPTNNIDNGNERLPPIRALGRARRPREDGPRRDVTKQTKQIKSATGPTQDKTKTKKLVDFSVVYCDVTERNRVAMSCHRHNVASRHYDGSRRCYYSGLN
jgi:hypothetical protein